MKPALPFGLQAPGQSSSLLVSLLWAHPLSLPTPFIPPPTHLQVEPDLQFSREENRHNLLPSWRFFKDVPPPSLSQEEAMCPLTYSPGPVLPGAVIEGGQSSCYPLLFHHPAPSSLLVPDLRTLASAHNPPSIPIFATVLEDPIPSPSYFNGLAPHSSAKKKKRGGRSHTHPGCHLPITQTHIQKVGRFTFINFQKIVSSRQEALVLRVVT